MKACTFLGHRDCPENIKGRLREEVERLIVYQQVDTFYVGTQGTFDRITYAVLKELRIKYPNIKVYRVLAYMPKLSDIAVDRSVLDDTILPEVIEKAHPRYAIVWRNNWMIDHSEYVVAYVTRAFGGAYQSLERAKKKGKMTIQIG